MLDLWYYEIKGIATWMDYVDCGVEQQLKIFISILNQTYLGN